MGEAGGEGLAGRLVGAAVGADRDRAVALADDVVRYRRESVPIAPQTREYAVHDGVRAAVGAAVDEALGLDPDDVGIHQPHGAGDIAGRHRGVETLERGLA